MISAHTAAAVRAAEEPLLAAAPPGALMERAAFAVATEVLGEIRRRGGRVPGTPVLALVGGGNNGGDALHAAAFLARRGAAATAALLTSEPHAAGLAAARAAGVREAWLTPGDGGWPRLAALAAAADVWLDGITGIGARGGLREPVASAVRLLVSLRSARPVPAVVVAVDIPSGIGVDDGTLPGPVLPADVTVTMGVAKPGLLLPPAAGLAGRIRVVDIGVADQLRERPPEAVRLETADVAGLWPVPAPTAHKYDRGVLGLVAGSRRYPGAAVLAVAGACGAGLGMVRYLGDEAVLPLIHGTHPEVVGTPGRVQAWALGSGVDPAHDGGAALRRRLVGALADGVPVVLDAGALAVLDPVPGRGAPPLLDPRVVLTPHAGELAAFLATRGARADGGGVVVRRDVESAPARWARRAAEETGATVLLKGAVTIVAPPTGPVLAQADATAWLATAGAGDVLAGVLGALLAGRSEDVRRDPGLAGRLAAAAASVHGRAAREASAGGPVTAGAVARRLPATVAALLSGA